MATLNKHIDGKDVGLHLQGPRIAIVIAILLLIWYKVMGGTGWSIAAHNPGAINTVNMGTLPAGTPYPYSDTRSWAEVQHGSFGPIWGNQPFHSNSY